MADEAKAQADAIEAKMRAGAPERRAVLRREYVRAHAPAVFGALLAGPNAVSVDDAVVRDLEGLRKVAIEQAGLLFDETEPAQ